jgi:hypothetical protein
VFLGLLVLLVRLVQQAHRISSRGAAGPVVLAGLVVLAGRAVLVASVALVAGVVTRM